MKNDLKKPCKECPFLKTSAEGWLGPWKSPRKLHDHIFMEADFACHKTMGGEDDTVPESEMSRCKGSLQYLSKACKLPRYNMELKEAVAAERGNHTDILNPMEFREHHTL